jgi:hypothetical protein
MWQKSARAAAWSWLITWVSSRRTMPWGLELSFHFGSLLVGAMQHQPFLDEVLCADEIVIVHDPALIERVKVSRSGETSGEWTTWPRPGPSYQGRACGITLIDGELIIID